MIMTIGNLAFSSVLKKKKLTGNIQYYKKMVGQTQNPWVRQNTSSRVRQNFFSRQLCNTECLV
jgi:hypothetical protein